MKNIRIIKGILAWVYALIMYSVFDMLNEHTFIGNLLAYEHNDMDKTVIGLMLTIVMIIFWLTFVYAGIKQFRMHKNCEECDEVQTKRKKGCSWWNPFC